MVLRRIGILASNLPCLYHNGQEYVFILRELGQLMGYDREGYGLVQIVKRDFKETLIEGEHWQKIKREDFKKFKAAYGPGWWDKPRWIETVTLEGAALIFRRSTKGYARGTWLPFIVDTLNKEEKVEDCLALFSPVPGRKTLPLLIETAWNMMVTFNGLVLGPKDYKFINTDALTQIVFRWDMKEHDKINVNFKSHTRFIGEWKKRLALPNQSMKELMDSWGMPEATDGDTPAVVEASTKTVDEELKEAAGYQSQDELLENMFVTPEYITGVLKEADGQIDIISDTPPPDMIPVLKKTMVFEKTDLHALEVNGKPALIAREVGKVLGYSDDGSRLVRMISQEWRRECLVGKDIEILYGKDAWDCLAMAGYEMPNPPIRRIMVIHESGLNMVLLKTNKPVGDRLRRHLADSVLPGLMTAPSYVETVREPVVDVAPERVKVDTFERHINPVEDVEPVRVPIPTLDYVPPTVVPDTAVTVAGATAVDVEKPPYSKPVITARDGELTLEQLSFERAQWEHKRAQEEYTDLQSLLVALVQAEQVDAKTALAHRVRGFERKYGRRLSGLMPEVSTEWQTPSGIASKYGVSENKIGRAISKLQIRGQDGLSKPILGARRHVPGADVVHYSYNTEAVKMIVDFMGITPVTHH